MKKEIKNWLDSGSYDLETAEHMFRYIYTIFMCHLSIEKALKAKVEEITGKTPPKTHSLGYLLELTTLSPSEKIEKFLGELNNLSVVTRYPKDFQEMFKAFTKERAEDFLKKTKEAFQWIEQLIKS
ncbi:MAG: HEPN domain-containing protein [bacterium]|nr:HEPN domain-containing protein [bacterium]